MAHIQLPEGIPGILGPMAFSPETAKPINALAEVLLRGPNTLSPGEREMIAAYVSSENDCYFCHSVHGAVAAHHLGGNETLIQEMKRNFEASAVSEKMKALLAIAGKVQKGGKHVTSEDIARARNTGATDKEIHDTVLIAAMFCMCNRYVDGLATWAPTEPEMYRENGKRLAQQGYIHSTDHLPVPSGD
ncbi:MAG: peroxidase-related enzyme [Candidatus Acidiferrales bacterium]